MSNEFNFSVGADGLVSVRVNNPDGTSSNKVVKYEDFSRIFLLDNQEIDLPLFPRGLRKYMVRGERTLVAIEYPATVVETARWRGQDTYRTIPVPPSVWFTLLQNAPNGNYKIIKSHLYALDFTGLMNQDSNLYKWPFPNHSLTYTPGICWGNDNHFSAIKNDCSLSNLSSLFSMYFSAEFNNDLGFHINHPNSDGNIFDMIKGEEEYDPSWLVPQGHNLNAAIENLIGSSR